ncbi:rhamnulokinase [Aerococcaceae bacterium zg-B36]|uniref:rhamnulokinase n=1 Tax=Aerococcaceae bacterium zg-252 TaxID=2796928 RepID=UPI001BD87109|nr:rhamnulokinase [Aerococcaceae bacterium zg-B36]
MSSKKILAIDLGASSGRLMQAIYNGKSLQLSEVHRFKNESVNINDGLYWDILYLFQEIKVGIKKATLDEIPIESISVDTWGVDYGFIDQHGDLLYNPHCYRDNRMGCYEEQFYSIVSKEELFSRTGVQPNLINTIMQIYADLQVNPYLRQVVKHVLFTPDLINYLLSDTVANEYTIASTSGLLDIHTQDWAVDLLNKLEIPVEWFLPVTKRGKQLRTLSPRITQELKIEPFSVITGAGHDTAAAVLAVPYEDKAHSAFISSGTWSLVGVESTTPVVTSQALEAGVTNEGCFTGDYRILKNTTGLWILQELRRDWLLKGEDISFADMVVLAQNVEEISCFINPNDEWFSTPNNMEDKIKQYCQRSNQPIPVTKGEIIRIVLESLAFSYRQTVEQIECLSNRSIQTIHMVGGGIQNKLLCQLTANHTGRKVIAGPVEASAMGNILSQLLTLNKIETLEEIVTLVKASDTTTVYEPIDNETIDVKYEQYKKIVKVGE